MSQNKPLMIELFAGLHGWGEGAVAEGYRVVGYDIVDMCELLGVPRPKGIELILRDVRSITGEECKDAAVIVASPPCQAYSYRAMPWKRAKALPPPDNTLFNECFRIQREASEAAGHYIPLIVENVRGAQKWVGRARWHYYSFYLWGDVPALMLPSIHAKVSGFRVDGESHGSFQSAAVAELKAGWDNSEYGKCRRADGRKVPGIKLSEVGFNVAAAQRYREGVKLGTSPGKRWEDRPPNTAAHREGTKQPGISGVRENGKGDRWFQDGAAKHGSRSDSRKAASAMIAKIPYPLASHIARCFYPAEVQP